MRVIGVDPGTVMTGFGVIEETHTVDLVYVASGTISMPSYHTLSERLKKIYDDLTAVFKRYSASAVVVEDTFVSRNAQAALRLGHARGVALLVAEMCGVPTFEYTPTQVKSSVVGYGLARKDQVKQMVIRLLGHPTDLVEQRSSYHASDALACAICHLHSVKVKVATMGS